MSTLFGGARARASDPNIPVPEAALRLTTSVQGKARPIGWGRNRVGANLIWLGGFKPYLVAGWTPQTATAAGGKGGGHGGGGGGTVTYTWNYLVDGFFSLAEGPIVGVVAVNSGNAWSTWAGAPTLTDPGADHFGAGNLIGPLQYATLKPGSQTQNPTGNILTNFSTQALAYRGEAYLALEPLLLGTSAQLPQMSFDVLFGTFCGLSQFPYESYAGDVILDYLTNPEYGVPGYTTDLIETPTEYNLFCGANSLLVSPVITDQVEGSSFINDLLQATHSAIFMTGGKLRIRPYAEADADDNGLTFTHDATPIYDIEPQDLLPGPNGGEPIDINRKQPQDMVNNLRLEYLNRDSDYSPAIIETRDEASIIAYGIERQSDVRAHHFFARTECASKSAAMQLQREQVTTTYTFNLPREFELLDPMDLLTLPLDKTGQGQARQAVRIIEIVENDDYSFSITAEEYLGTADMPIYSRQNTTHNLPDFNVSAGDVNTPIIFELPSLISRGLNIYAAVSGQNPDAWGGADVWVSYDGETYIFAERILSNARMGVTASHLPISTASAGAGSGAGFIYSENIELGADAGLIASATGGTIANVAQISLSPRIAASPGAASGNVGAGFAVSPHITTAAFSPVGGEFWSTTDRDSGISLSPGNTIATGTVDRHALVRGDTPRSAGNLFFEITVNAITTSGGTGGVGVANSSASLTSYLGGDHANGQSWFADGYIAGPGFEGSTSETYGAGAVIGILCEFASLVMSFYKDGTLKQVRTLPAGGNLFPCADSRHVGDQFTLNCGSSPFIFQPTGSISWDGTRTGTGTPPAPPVMPSGALGIWYVDQYSAPGIPNAAGSTPLTTAGTADGNMYLAGGTVPSGGSLDFNSGEIGFVVLPSSVTLTEATVIYSCYKEADSSGIHVIMADRASYHFWSVGEDISGFGPGFQIFNNGYTGQQTGSLWDKVGNGWHISSHSYDASSAECWIDGIKVISNSASPGSNTISSLDIGQVAGSINAGYKVNAIAFYNRKLTASEQASAYAALRNRAALSSITIPSTNPEKILFAMGDSITDGSFGNTGIAAANPGYVYAAARLANPVIRGVNLGVGGRTIATTDTAFDSTYGPMISAAIAAGSSRDIICSLSLGTNDLLTYPGGVSAWLTAFATLCDKVRATGAKLIVGTLQANIDPTFNSRRATANATIRTWIGTHADAIMDFGSDSIMGADATASNGTYFQDGTHPTGAGHARLAPYLVAAINSL